MNPTFAQAKIRRNCWVHHWIGQSDMNTKLDKSNNFIISLDSFLSHLDLDREIIK